MSNDTERRQANSLIRVNVSDIPPILIQFLGYWIHEARKAGIL
jgi:hypothetical protein